MTEWMGIKAGELYKMTGRGSRGAPLRFVLGFERAPWSYDANRVYMLSTVGGRVVKTSMSDRNGGLTWSDEVEEGHASDPVHYGWPYKRISA